MTFVMPKALDEIEMAKAEREALAVMQLLRQKKKRQTASFDSFNMTTLGNGVIHVHTEAGWPSILHWFKSAGAEVKHHTWMGSLHCWRVVFRAAKLEE